MKDMSSVDRDCDSGLVDEYVSQGLPELITDELARHLESCTACRSRLAKTAADPELWDEAIELLKPFSGIDSDVQDRALGTDFEPIQQSASPPKILDWLMPTDDPEMLGRVGEYEINGVVGVGGMGSVLKGFDRSLLRVVAIKVMAPHLADNGTARNRFEREAHAAAAISHDNVIAIHRVAETNGLPYIVMPFARGPSLQKRIQESGPLSTIEIVRVGRQIASGLAAAHELGLVHRDIKPANILLNDCIERILITDFGVARAMDDVSMTQTGVIAGTPQYMSPEQARGESVDCRSDLFCLGALLYTACTGRAPFRAESAYGILRRITDSDHRPIQDLNPEIPIWLCRLIDRLLLKHPLSRYQSAGEVARLFERCLAHLQQPTHAAVPDSLLVADDSVPPINVGIRETKNQPFKKILRTGALLMGAVLTTVVAMALAFQLTSAPDVVGDYDAEAWGRVRITKVGESDEWYAGTIKDNEGNTGSIHLEWSRMQRRFNGRWTLTQRGTGAITLRPDSGELLRGAILIDSNSDPQRNDAGLRDFVWSKTTPTVTSFGPDESEISRIEMAEKNESESASQNDIHVASPINAVILKLANGLVEGAEMEKGDFIMELEPWPSSVGKELQIELKALRIERQLAVAKLESAENMVCNYEEASELTVASSVSEIKEADAKIAAKRKLVAGYEAKFVQARLNLKRQNELASNNESSSDKELEKLANYLDVCKAELGSARADEAALEKVKENIKLKLAQQKLQSQSQVILAKSKVSDTKLALANVEAGIRIVESKLADQERMIILMPADGSLRQIGHCVVGAKVSEGDTLFSFVRGTGIAKGKAAQPMAVVEKPANTMRPNFEESSGILEITFESMANLDKRLRAAKAKIADSERELKTRSARRAELLYEMKKVEERIESLKESETSPVQQANLGQLKTYASSKEHGLQRNKASAESFSRAIEAAKAELKAAQTAKEMVVRICKLRLDLSVSQLDVKKQNYEMTKSRYEISDTTLQQVADAEQLYQWQAANVSELETVLEYAKQLGQP